VANHWQSDKCKVRVGRLREPDFIVFSSRICHRGVVLRNRSLPANPKSQSSVSLQAENDLVCPRLTGGHMGKICTWAIVLFGFGVIGTDLARAQDGDDAQACWWEYASCARQSFGDATWRSVCYADFSTCIGKMQLPACPATPAVADCLAYKTECDAIAGDDAGLLADCSADADACALAHGC
jgi:hypothetical protein